MIKINNIRNTVTRTIKGDNSWHCYTTAMIFNMNFVCYSAARNEDCIIEIVEGPLTNAQRNWFFFRNIFYETRLPYNREIHDRGKYYL